MDKELFGFFGVIAAFLVIVFGALLLVDILKKDCTIKLAGKYTATEIELLCK